MAVSSGTSFILSLILITLLFSGMQMYRGWFASFQMSTIVGGYFGSLLFILLLTAIGNLETIVFGKSFQTKLFPEIALCLLTAMTASAMIHRVSATTCLLFSVVHTYYINQIAQKTYTTPVQFNVQLSNKKKK